MKIEVTTCYSHVLWLLCAGPLLEQAIDKIEITKSPAFSAEGIAGYIETQVCIHVKDLQCFTNLWNSFYSLSDKRRLYLYGLAKELGDCK